MPPKRAASGASTAANKKAKTSSGEPPRSKRWSAVSGSANADADYKTTWKNPDKWYSFVTICPPSADDDDEDEEDEEEDEDNEDSDEESENEEGSRDGPRCGRKHCMCFKPAGENPDHPWVVSQAGYRKYDTQHIFFALRDPDNFEMHTYNDHAGYGCVEMVQNLILDYVEAAERGWREQWAVCEGLGLWLLSPSSGPMMMIDDADCVEDTMRLVGRMFLDMLAQLDGMGLVGDATEVKSLGTFMAVYMEIASEVREVGVLEGDREGGKAVNKKAFQPSHFDDAVLSYANQRGVTLQGPENIDEMTAKLDGEVKLPEKNAKDPWGFTTSLKSYKKTYSKGKGSTIGGDDLDITTWTSSQRKEASFTRKDPLGKREIDALKKGMVMQLG
ncbi:hypothetical protein F4811DRAFT_109001 [Daldinia bambusicola]|nr:hypothetical protein F4811DRAFT_109001 [Daldinia bambusicola]